MTKDSLFQKYRHHYILVMMIVTRVFGAVGGLAVMYYVDFTQKLPQPIRLHFWLICAVVTVLSTVGTILLALRDTRHSRAVLEKIEAGRAWIGPKHHGRGKRQSYCRRGTIRAKRGMCH